jgi:hypothetical protein
MTKMTFLDLESVLPVALPTIFDSRFKTLTFMSGTKRDHAVNILVNKACRLWHIIKSRRMRWAGHVARMGEKRNVYWFLVGKPKGKRPLGRPRRRWIDNIKMDLLEIELSVVDWIGLV